MVNLNITEAGSKWWYKGTLHRIDGPAIIIPNGTNQYWVDGKQVSEYEQMFIMETTYD